MVKIKNTLVACYRNFRGWTTNRKIIVFESDDWGSIRMPSHETYKQCLSKGYPVNLNPYERYDSLTSKDDLDLLFNLLLSYKDKNGNHPVITANCVVANPDFEKIKKDDFANYHFELITETFKKYPNHSGNFDLWKEGINNGIFFPQYHAREHLNVTKFMKALQDNDPDVHFGFQRQMPGNIRRGNNNNGNYFVEATNYNSVQDKAEKLNIYLEGLGIFEKLFGFKSASIIPTNYTWSNDFNEPVSEKGVKYIQGIRKMKEPGIENQPVYTRRILGKKNNFGQLEIVRNVTFEPTLIVNPNKVDNTLSEIDIAFRMKKPAVISSHRINYVGFIDASNRDRNLKSLDLLLMQVTKKWPDVEFMSTVNLGNLISKN